ncbi:hypothetical protein EV421DRAFT_1740763 [Armillaria borealis]|uniref:Uncharacterized protein n=1 Tax=Armillaria borealis TaxID=47425 RepID=A0AA39J585_9AGAR|nr:hypothetical protein EV421DRAFT_1740763 [Armillaria borealis]
MTTLPPELIEIIVREVWHSDMPSYIRKLFMTTCPRINRAWKAVYAPIASQDIPLPVSSTSKNTKRELEGAVKEAYRYLIGLPNIIGFQTLFPLIPYISFEIIWIGIGRFAPLKPLRGVPIRARYDRLLSNAFSPNCPRGWAQMDVYIAMPDPDPSGVIRNSIWSHILRDLRNVGVPKHFFGIIVADPGSYDVFVEDGVRHFVQATYIFERNFKDRHLTDYDSRNINKRLWLASNNRHTLALRCFTSLFHRWECKRVQSSLPLIVSGRWPSTNYLFISSYLYMHSYFEEMSVPSFARMLSLKITFLSNKFSVLIHEIEILEDAVDSTPTLAVISAQERTDNASFPVDFANSATTTAVLKRVPGIIF